MARIMTATDRTSRVLTVSLSVPKTMGTGPIIITPPPLVLPRPRTPLKKNRRAAEKVIMNPTMMSAKPRATRVAWSSNWTNPG